MGKKKIDSWYADIKKKPSILQSNFTLKICIKNRIQIQINKIIPSKKKQTFLFGLSLE